MPLRSRSAAPALLVVLALVGLPGCAATYTAIAKRNLDVQTKMTETIFLDPVAPAERSVYVEVKNTSDKADFDLQSAIREKVTAKGYRLVEDPRAARYILQANVLQAGKNTDTAAVGAYRSGFGGTLVGGAAGGAVGYGIGRAGGGNDLVLGAGGAILGAAAETITGAYVQDVTYSIVTDIQVQERSPGVVVTESENAQIEQGTSGQRTQTTSKSTDLKRYRTRVVSKANKVNLEWQEAVPALVDGLTRSIAGIF